MERLPYIDDHATVIATGPDRTWSALLSVVAQATNVPLPRPVLSAWGLRQTVHSGNWAGPAVGDTIPGFAVAEIDPPRLLTLRGQHRFSRYELRFTVEPAGADHVELHARTSAQFPGPLGRIYRTLVIGSRGHVIAVRRILVRVARQAERP